MRAKAFAVQITAASRVMTRAAGIESPAKAMSATTNAAVVSSRGVPWGRPSSRTPVRRTLPPMRAAGGRGSRR